MIRKCLLIPLILVISACANHHHVGTVYRTQVGRTVTEMFHDGSTTWLVGAEFRFDVK